MPILAQRKSCGVALTHLQPGAKWKWVVSTALRPLYIRKRPDTLLQESYGSQGWTGRARKISSPPGFDPLYLRGLRHRYYVCVCVCVCVNYHRRRVKYLL